MKVEISSCEVGDELEFLNDGEKLKKESGICCLYCRGDGEVVEKLLNVDKKWRSCCCWWSERDDEHRKRGFCCLYCRLEGVGGGGSAVRLKWRSELFRCMLRI